MQWSGGVENGGGEEWRKHGRKHRVGGPASQWAGGVKSGGDEEWWVEGKRHRIGGPAIQRLGGVSLGGGGEHYVEGKRHRLDGPAVVWSGGYKEWWVGGERLDPEIENLLDGITFESEQEGLSTINHLKELQKRGLL